MKSTVYHMSHDTLIALLVNSLLRPTGEICKVPGGWSTVYKITYRDSANLNQTFRLDPECEYDFDELYELYQMLGPGGVDTWVDIQKEVVRGNATAAEVLPADASRGAAH